MGVLPESVDEVIALLVLTAIVGSERVTTSIMDDFFFPKVFIEVGSQCFGDLGGI
jgi:hypothetical protein